MTVPSINKGELHKEWTTSCSLFLGLQIKLNFLKAKQDSYFWILVCQMKIFFWEKKVELLRMPYQDAEILGFLLET